MMCTPMTAVITVLKQTSTNTSHRRTSPLRKVSMGLGMLYIVSQLVNQHLVTIIPGIISSRRAAFPVSNMGTTPQLQAGQCIRMLLTCLFLWLPAICSIGCQTASKLKSTGAIAHRRLHRTCRLSQTLPMHLSSTLAPQLISPSHIALHCHRLWRHHCTCKPTRLLMCLQQTACTGRRPR